MLAQSPPRPPVQQPPTTYQEPVPPPPPMDMTAAWAFIWTLFAFKMATVALIFWHHPTHVTSIFLVATTWFWILVPIVALAGPIAFRWRLIRLRKRRAALRRSEWLLAEDRLPSETSRR